MNTYEWITTLLIPVTSVVSWIAGSRMRRNETIKALQTTIDMLVNQNADLYKEMLSLRQENSSLKDEGFKRDLRIAELELEIERMKK